MDVAHEAEDPISTAMPWSLRLWRWMCNGRDEINWEFDTWTPPW